MLTAQLLLGLLLSVGYNPQREWPRRRIKVFTIHNWLGYIAIATALLHPLILLASSTAGFRLFDVFVPIWSPTQPLPNTLGAMAFYLLAFVVVTSYFRRAFGRRRWKQLHYTAYALAVVAKLVDRVCPVMASTPAALTEMPFGTSSADPPR